MPERVRSGNLPQSVIEEMNRRNQGHGQGDQGGKSGQSDQPDNVGTQPMPGPMSVGIIHGMATIGQETVGFT